MLLRVVQKIFYLNSTAYLQSRFNALTVAVDNCVYSLHIYSVIVVADDVDTEEWSWDGGVYQHQEVKVAASG